MLSTYRLRTAKNKRIDLGAPLNEGGEGRLYLLRKQQKVVAKIYHQGKGPQSDKIELMVKQPLRTSLLPIPLLDRDTPTIVWPNDVLYDERNRFVGFTMKQIEQAHELQEVYTPLRRKKHFPDLTQPDLYMIAADIAAAFRLIHAQEHVVGDVNQRNVMVDQKLRVIIIDTDSFQIGPYNCRTFVEEYSSPQLLSLPSGTDLAKVPRGPEYDCFGLAVLIFQLLHNGAHPFQSRWNGAGDNPPLAEKIKQNLFPHAPQPDRRIMPPPSVPPLETLDPQVRGLFLRCFVDGHSAPHKRPSAAEWEGALRKAQKELRSCNSDKTHFYAPHLSSCPYCEIHPPQPQPSPGERFQQGLAQARASLLHIGQYWRDYWREILQSVQLWVAWVFATVLGVVIGSSINPSGALFLNLQGMPDFSFAAMFSIGFFQVLALSLRVNRPDRWRWLVNLLISLLVLITTFRLLQPALLGLGGLLAPLQAWISTTWPAASSFTTASGILGSWLLVGVATGASLGGVQWLFLRRYTIRAHLWIAFSILSWSLTALGLVLFGNSLLTSLILGTVGGLGMAVLLWRRGQRVARQRLPWTIPGVLVNLIVLAAVLANLVVSGPARPAAVAPTIVATTQATGVPAAAVATVTTTQVAPTAPPAVLAIGVQARIVTSGGENALVRSQPGTAARVIERLPPDTLVEVIDGPEQANNLRWWRIQSGTTEGWVADILLRVDE